VFQQLLDDLRSPREGTRVSAVRTLSTSGYPETASALLPLLADPASAVQLETLDALISLALAPPPDPQLAEPLKRSGGSIAWSVFDVGPLAVLPREWPPALVARLSALLQDDDSRVRVAAAGTLAVLAPQEVPQLSHEAQSALITAVVYALRHPDPATRESAATAAGAMFVPPRGGEAVPVAIGDALIAALNDTEPGVRTAATDALGWVREARAEHALQERFAYYKRGSEAHASLHALARIAGAGSAGTFRQALSSREDPVRVMALEGLARLGDRAALPAITAQMQAERKDPVLLAAAFAVHLLGERANLGRLVEALAKPALARQARAYLTELGPAVARDLHPWLQHGDATLRRTVAEVLGLSGNAGSEAELQALARSDSAAAVAAAARQAALRLRAFPHGVRTR
jgi:HEAT repeat protein